MPLISSKNLGWGGHWPHSAEEASCNPPADPHNACLSRTARRGFQQVMLKTDQQVWPSLVLLRPHCGPAHRLSHLHRSPRPSAKPRPPLLEGPFTQWAQDKAATRSQSQSESKRERSPDPVPGSPSRPETGRGASLVPGASLWFRPREKAEEQNHEEGARVMVWGQESLGHTQGPESTWLEHGLVGGWWTTWLKHRLHPRYFTKLQPGGLQNIACWAQAVILKSGDFR